MIKALLAAVFLAVPSWGQQNALPTQIPVQYRDFSGGLVDNVDPANIKPNESPRLLNVVVDDPVGSLKPRKGIQACGAMPSGNSATALYEYAKSDGTRRLIATDNATVYETADCRTFTTVASGLSSSAQVHFATVRDKLWIVNGSTWPRTWDGSTLSILDGRANTPSSPTMPKCALIEFWKERVWCGAPSGELSAVYYSALTDTDGNDLDPSTGTTSWPVNNNFQIDQNGGSRLYAIKAYRNRMYAFKSNGIWEIGFDNDFNNFVRKSFVSVGSRFQTSIAEVDGILYFTGIDGIYAFDGENAVRVSEKIDNKFRTLNQPLVSQNYKTWDSPSDFTAGTLTANVSTSPVPGSISITSNTVTNGDFELGSTTNWTFAETQPSGGGGTCHNGTLAGVTSDTPIQGTYSGRLRAINCQSDPTTGCAQIVSNSDLYYRHRLIDGNGTELIAFSSTTSSPVTIDLSGLSTNYVRLQISDSLGQTTATLNVGIVASRKLRFSFTDGAGGYCNGDAYGFLERRFDVIEGNISSGTWTSEVYNAVAVSTWQAFSAEGTDNGGSILYEIRTGADAAAVAAASYSPITPGTIIPSPSTHLRAQVRATLNPSSDYFNSPRLDLAQIAWNSGGNNTQKIHAAGWRNALWVSASSGTASSNNAILRRAARPLDSWTLYDLQIGPMTTYNDNFYGAASTSAVIYRMDYGTNDDGRAITWYWESRDEQFGLPNNAKFLPEMNIDYRANSSCNIRAGYVQDSNTTYCVGNFPSPNALLATGTGSRRLNFTGGPAYSYRLKICDDQKDQSPTIIGVGAWARPIQRRGD